MKQPEEALNVIRQMEAIYDPQWAERNAMNAVMLDDAYGAYYHATGEYDKALPHLERLLNYYRDNNIVNATLIIKNSMARTYFEKTDYQASAEIYRQIMEMKDSIHSERFYAYLDELIFLSHNDHSLCRFPIVFLKLFCVNFNPVINKKIQFPFPAIRRCIG